ncbi:hypothetical protein MSP7336_04366 [Mycobacterium shimoidei]|uniref:Secreted protein n=1 Tax=Mycobacterium shimoidei TaxID=29313 RepID=A0A375Z4I9_MYCSH|nr:hypothetical protein [Mycobacterium shimoidei]SRX96091.1 hypothetical protein MSP7336_04366 [Mycobacterium shimoidei]
MKIPVPALSILVTGSILATACSAPPLVRDTGPSPTFSNEHLHSCDDGTVLPGEAAAKPCPSPSPACTQPPGAQPCSGGAGVYRPAAAPDIETVLGVDGVCHIVVRTGDGRLWQAAGATEWGGRGGGGMLAADPETVTAWEAGRTGCDGAAPNDVDAGRPTNQHGGGGTPLPGQTTAPKGN